MGMIQIDNVMNALAESRAAKSTDNPTCLIIRTGDADCIARFYPALYQLTLVKHGIEEKVDLGFAGGRLLERLARNPGEVVDREELMNHAWPGRVVGQGSLNQQVYTLRQILADESEREIIQTLPRRGYLLNPNFVDISLEANPVAETPVPGPIVSPTPVATRVVTTQTTTPITPIAKPSGFNWRIPALAGWSALLVLGAVFAYNLATATKIPAANSNGKLLTITYAPQHPEDLVKLIPHGENIERRLTAKVKTPLHVVVELHESQLNVVCLRDGNARTLHIAEGHLDQLTDADLAPCLP